MSFCACVRSFCSVALILKCSKHGSLQFMTTSRQYFCLHVANKVKGKYLRQQIRAHVGFKDMKDIHLEFETELLNVK